MSARKFNHRVDMVLREVTETQEINVQLEYRKGGRYLVIATRDFYGYNHFMNGWIAIGAQDLEMLKSIASGIFKAAIGPLIDASEAIEFTYGLNVKSEKGEPQELRDLLYLRGNERTINIRLYNKEGDIWCAQDEECVVNLGVFYGIIEALEFGPMAVIGKNCFK